MRDWSNIPVDLTVNAALLVIAYIGLAISVTSGHKHTQPPAPSP